ncbi:hypothetical protein WKW79_29010 [Variovorax robiniae]|uniref:Uncharacterized protein n=1 Tax=Variovorax robiniae TaxID=1836199 RepID=A0ABU8XFJ9_9BURK
MTANGTEAELKPLSAAQQRELEIPTPERTRRFFPCNREDALILLAGLIISDGFPDEGVRLALQSARVALVEVGLRTTEAALLEAGRSERFPILLELDPGFNPGACHIVGYADIARLVFRSQSEADAFRFRPVDEFDPESVAWQVEPACFGLEGPARFELVERRDPGNLSLGHLVDRIVAGIHCMVELTETQPACLPAVGHFLSNQANATEFNLAGAVAALTAPAEADGAAMASAVVHAFAQASDASARELIDALAHGFTASGSDDDRRGREVEEKWVRIARDVTANRAPLDGDLLSDDKSVLLRAALLALQTDGPTALAAFLTAPKPSGVMVSSAAAFLVGLKQGLINAPWRLKGPRAQQLSFIARALLESLAQNGGQAAAQVISVSSADSDHSTRFSLSMAGRPLIEWEEEKAPDPVEMAWRTDFVRLGYQVVGKGEVAHSWLIALPDDQRIEVVHCNAGGARFPMLRFRLAADRKPRKVKEVDTNFERGGRLWYPRVDASGQRLLCCDLPALPDIAQLGLLAHALSEAVELCSLPPKPVARPRKKSTKPPAA